MSRTTLSIPILISTSNSVRDVNHFVLPSGDYYFEINRMGRHFIQGKVTGIQAAGQARARTPPFCNLPFEFSVDDLIKMIARAQAKLCNRLGLRDRRLPRLSSRRAAPAPL